MHRVGAAEHAGTAENDVIGAILEHRLPGFGDQGALGRGQILLQLQHRNVDRTRRSELAGQTINRRLGLDHWQDAAEHGDDAEFVTHHRRDAHRCLHGSKHGNGHAFAGAEQAGIAHAVDHHGVDAVTLRFDDAGDRARLGEHDLVVAFDRGGAGVDIDEVDLYALALKLRRIRGSTEPLRGNRRDDTDVNSHRKPPLVWVATYSQDARIYHRANVRGAAPFPRRSHVRACDIIVRLPETPA
jgi:hypothetical protein